MARAAITIKRDAGSVFSFVADLENAPWWLQPVRAASESLAAASKYEIYVEHSEHVGTAWWESPRPPDEATLRLNLFRLVSPPLESKVVLAVIQKKDPQPMVNVAAAAESGAQGTGAPKLGVIARKRKERESRKLWNQRLVALRKTLELHWDKHPAKTRPRLSHLLDDGVL
jgi:hypothetical protein